MNTTKSVREQEKETMSALQSTILNRKLIEAEIVSRAWADEDFRKKLETDPVAALAEAGIPLLQGKTVSIIPEDPEIFHISLPSKPEVSVEMNEEELEATAGSGLIDTGRCQLYKDAQDKENYQEGFAFTFGVLVGVSWGHT